MEVREQRAEESRIRHRANQNPLQQSVSRQKIESPEGDELGVVQPSLAEGTERASARADEPVRDGGGAQAEGD